MRGVYIFHDGVANSTTTFTSATAAFTSDDVGLSITGLAAGIPAGTTIASRTNATTIILSNPMPGSGSGLTFTIAARVPLSIKMGRLPTAYEFTPSDYRSIFLQRFEISLSGSNVLIGTYDTAAVTNVGPCFDAANGSWLSWNETTAQYEPIDIGLINGNFGTTINAAPTANRTLTLPNTTGTALLLQDVAIPKATVVLTSTGGTVSTIDANISNNFILTLTENSTIPSLTNIASGSGKRIRIVIINDGTSFTVTWPSAGANAIKWPGASAPTQPVASAGFPSALAIYTITEANLGITPHLWGEPELSGFGGIDTIDTGGAVNSGSAYLGGDLPPAKGRNPYNIP